METKNVIIRLTQFSHGAGCGCKISPKILDSILKSNLTHIKDKNLIVGNDTKDDAAVYDLGNGMGLISTTDFFMPIVDDPFEFGKIASANAISDVYAMGGKPILAIAILGWPVNTIPPHVAQKVIEGSREICREAGIALAGGHSIDSPEPIFGLAVNGLVALKNLKQNSTAKAGDFLYLTKKLGVGILTTAEKKGILKKEHTGLAAKQMMQLNKIGERLGELQTVHAMTDVTGFGLLGHLVEMCEGSGLSAAIDFSSVQTMTNLEEYIQQKSTPGGTQRNWESYGEKIEGITDFQKAILADPQTSGGLLVAVGPAGKNEFEDELKKYGMMDFVKPIGEMKAKAGKCVYVK